MQTYFLGKSPNFLNSKETYQTIDRLLDIVQFYMHKAN